MIKRLQRLLKRAQGNQDKKTLAELQKWPDGQRVGDLCASIDPTLPISSLTGLPYDPELIKREQ